MRKEKILIITSFTIPDFAGGGINAWRLGSYLAGTGRFVLLLTLNRKLRLAGKETIGGVTIRRIGYFNQNLLTKYISYFFLILPSMMAHIIRSGHVYLVGGNIIGYQGILLLGRFFGRPVIFRSSLLGYDDLESLSNRARGLKWLSRIALGSMGTYISINPEFSRAAHRIGIGEQDLIEISQGVDIKIFRPVPDETRHRLRRQLGIPGNIFVILSVGFVLARKGYRESFEFLSSLEGNFLYLQVGETAYPKDHFLFPDLQETRELVQFGEKLLGPRLKTLRADQDMSGYYQVSDICLINSRQEGTPNVLLEAMATGIPVLCRSLPGIKDYLVIDGSTGYNFTDFDTFRQGFNALKSDPGFRRNLGRNARKLVEKEHSMEKLCKLIFADG